MNKFLTTTAVIFTAGAVLAATLTPQEELVNTADEYNYSISGETVADLTHDLINEAEKRAAHLAIEAAILKIVDKAADYNIQLNTRGMTLQNIGDIVDEIAGIAAVEIIGLNEQIATLQSEVEVKAGVIESQNDFIMDQWDTVDGLNAEIDILNADIVAYQESANQAVVFYNQLQDAQAKLDAVLAIETDDHDFYVFFGKGGNQIRFGVNGSYIGEAFKWKEKSGDLVETNDDAIDSIIEALEDAYKKGFKDAINDAHDAAD